MQTVRNDRHTNEYRKLPSVSKLLQHEEINALLRQNNRKLVVEALRDALQQARAVIASGESAPAQDNIVEFAKKLPPSGPGCPCVLL
ncbi:MAG: hypothetical protein ACUVRS_12545 [Armatimonadota bacterium]